MSENKRFFETRQDTMIANWLHRMDIAFPQQYNLELLRSRAQHYIAMYADLHIPMEQHPFYQEFRTWCEEHFVNDIPIHHILQSSVLFREAFLETIAEFDVERAELMRIVAAVTSRIDAFQTKVYTYFWEHARGKIEQQDKMIEDMHADKLNLIGKMASSMAHEIRNPLTTIKGFITLIRKALTRPESDMIGKYMDIIDDEFYTIEHQIKGFLSFSRKPIADEDFTLASMSELIEKTLLLANPLLMNENIELTQELEEGLEVLVQTASVVQVFSNLLNNAIDALRDAKGDRIISMRTYTEGPFAYAKFTNTGPEIPPDIQPRLFDPFVTSKTDGTGLGLAISKQIVERNGGTIAFETDRRETSFIVRFKRLSDSRAR